MHVENSQILAPAYDSFMCWCVLHWEASVISVEDKIGRSGISLISGKIMVNLYSYM